MVLRLRPYAAALALSALLLSATTALAGSRAGETAENRAQSVSGWDAAQVRAALRLFNVMERYARLTQTDRSAVADEQRFEANASPDGDWVYFSHDEKLVVEFSHSTVRPRNCVNVAAKTDSGYGPTSEWAHSIEECERVAKELFAELGIHPSVEVKSSRQNGLYGQWIKVELRQVKAGIRYPYPGSESWALIDRQDLKLIDMWGNFAAEYAGPSEPRISLEQARAAAADALWRFNGSTSLRVTVREAQPAYYLLSGSDLRMTEMGQAQREAASQRRAWLCYDCIAVDLHSWSDLKGYDQRVYGVIVDAESAKVSLLFPFPESIVRGMGSIRKQSAVSQQPCLRFFGLVWNARDLQGNSLGAGKIERVSVEPTGAGMRVLLWSGDQCEFARFNATANLVWLENSPHETAGRPDKALRAALAKAPLTDNRSFGSAK